MKGYGSPPLTNAGAWELVKRICADPRCRYVEEPLTTEERWKCYAARETALPKIWMDAYLAAFSVAGDYSFVTFDRGFLQFKGLDVILLV